MAEHNEPTFEVQRIETSHGEMTALVPQFRLSDLSDDERADYDALRDAGASHYSGAIAVTEIAESQFKEDGETVTFAEVEERHEEAIRGFLEVFEEIAESIERQVTPAMSDLAGAVRQFDENADTDR